MRGVIGWVLSSALVVVVGFCVWRWPAWQHCQDDTATRAALLSGLDVIGVTLGSERSPSGATCYFETHGAAGSDVAIVRVMVLGDGPAIVYVRRPGRSGYDYVDPRYEQALGRRSGS